MSTQDKDLTKNDNVIPVPVFYCSYIVTTSVLLCTSVLSFFFFFFFWPEILCRYLYELEMEILGFCCVFVASIVLLCESSHVSQALKCRVCGPESVQSLRLAAVSGSWDNSVQPYPRPAGCCNL